MPRGFTEQEREQIRARLIEAGREQFGRFGLVKTNVAELARAAGIAKGSFYLFFDSKEELLMTVLVELGDAAHAEVLEQLEAVDDDPEALFKRYFFTQVELLEREPLLRMLTDPEVFQRLLRKVPQEQVVAHYQDDLKQAAEMLERWRTWGLMVDLTPEMLEGVGRAVFALYVQREVIGEAFPEVLRMLLDGLARQVVRKERRS